MIGVRRPFATTAIIQLFDEEIAVNDDLGSELVDADEAGLGPRRALFHQASSARYILDYYVE
jgi:hypothetical protein